MMAARAIEVRTLGISVTPMTPAETAGWVAAAQGKTLILNHNLHSAYLYQKDAAFRALYARADRTVVDGMPILLAASLSSRRWIGARYRVGSTDWIECLTDAENAGTLLVYGAAEESNHAAVAKLRQQLEPCGWTVNGLHGYVSHDEAVRWLQGQSPTLVLVGMGMPVQEHFLLEYWEDLPEAVYATVGGAIDYVAGRVVLAPRWMGRLGLEWLWRLAHAPKRLAHRYLVEPLLLVATLVTHERRRTSSDNSTRGGLL